MQRIQPKVLIDENMKPVAVQIDYADWVQIKKLLGQQDANGKVVDLSQFAGTVKWPEDGVEYQRRVREEWSFFWFRKRITESRGAR